MDQLSFSNVPGAVTAECIVERPELTAKGPYLLLADFNTVTFGSDPSLGDYGFGGDPCYVSDTTNDGPFSDFLPYGSMYGANTYKMVMQGAPGHYLAVPAPVPSTLNSPAQISWKAIA